VHPLLRNGPNFIDPWPQVGDAELVGCDIQRRYSTVGPVVFT
jgi:hypothetical protein